MLAFSASRLGMKTRVGASASGSSHRRGHLGPPAGSADCRSPPGPKCSSSSVRGGRAQLIFVHPPKGNHRFRGAGGGGRGSVTREADGRRLAGTGNACATVAARRTQGSRFRASVCARPSLSASRVLHVEKEIHTKRGVGRWVRGGWGGWVRRLSSILRRRSR